MIKRLNKIFNQSGIYKFKYVYIYSDFILFFKYCKKNPKKEVTSFLELFTKKGITCIVPSFSYTTLGKFDVKKTPSKVGFLGNFIMKNCKYERSEHPLFSYVAIGKNKKIVKNIGKSAFGKESVHHRLFNKKCCFLNFCRPLKKGNTLIHHIEHIKKINYRYSKIFYTKVFLKKKFFGSRYSAFLRKDTKNFKTSFTFEKVMKYLKNTNYIKTEHVGKLKLEIYDYDKFYKDLLFLINKNKKNFIKG